MCVEAGAIRGLDPVKEVVIAIGIEIYPVIEDKMQV